jgi:hypothetical protein
VTLLLVIPGHQHQESYLYRSMIYVMAACVARGHSAPPEPVPGDPLPQAAHDQVRLPIAG